MHFFINLRCCGTEEREGNVMKIMMRKTSSICKTLIDKTIMQEIDWVSYNSFQDYLDVAALSMQHIVWLRDYFKHLQSARYIPVRNKLYFVFYQDRIFAISQSKYSGEIRLDFTSDFQDYGIWRGIIASQQQLIQLLSSIDVTSSDSNTDETCKELLYSTGCIRA